MAHAGLSVDSFTDAVRTEVSFADGGNRVVGGVGLRAESERAWEGGMLSLHGSVGLERAFRDLDTEVEVSGERLDSESERDRVLLGVGGVYEREELFFGAEVSTAGLGSDDRQYRASLTLRMRL